MLRSVKKRSPITNYLVFKSIRLVGCSLVKVSEFWSVSRERSSVNIMQIFNQCSFVTLNNNNNCTPDPYRKLRVHWGLSIRNTRLIQLVSYSKMNLLRSTLNLNLMSVQRTLLVPGVRTYFKYGMFRGSLLRRRSLDPSQSRSQSLCSPWPAVGKRKTMRPTISDVRNRCRLLSKTGWAAFGYFLVISKSWVAPRASRSPTAGQA